MLLLVAAAYCVQRACEKDSSRWWLIAAGVAVGFGFLAKMLQAFLVLPGFAAAYLIAGTAGTARESSTCLARCVAVVVSGGWYLLLVELWPASSRPYIGGSQHNSIVELALGYNGLGRLTGDEPGGLGNLNLDVGWGRLFGTGMGLDIAWLLPAAVICLAAGLVITRRAPRTDPTRAALIVWGGWLAVTAAVFSFMNGIMHPYYTVALAPAIGACIGIGATLLWRNRSDIRAATALSGTVLVTTVLAAVLLSRHGEWHAVAAGHGRGRAEWAPPCCCWSLGRLTRPVARVGGGPRRGGVSGRARGVLDRDGGDAAHAARFLRSGPSRNGAAEASPGPAGCLTRRPPGRR